MEGRVYTSMGSQIENLMRRRFLCCPSFEIYGGSAGLFDLGPIGCGLKNEIESFWRRHYVVEENLLEISATCLTPHPVLKASGHVDRFTDLMIRDTVNGECYRGDKLLQEVIQQRLAVGEGGNKKNQKKITEKKGDKKNRKTAEDAKKTEESAKNTEENAKTSEQNAENVPNEELEKYARIAETMDAEQLNQAIFTLNIKSPNNNPLSYPFPFNLMFKTKIGPKEHSEKGENVAYLRPETAQGIFLNFKRLYEFNGSKLPFGAAQIGLGFRNEIAPRNGLIRVREFQMGEIEYFVDPDRRMCGKLELVGSLKLPLYSRASQEGGGGIEWISLEEATSRGVIRSQWLAYFLGRSFLFLQKLGIDIQNGLRYRQHLPTEMAHYAQECWDAELQTSQAGWLEVFGHADRAAFDLQQHAKATGVDLEASRLLEKPRKVEFLRYTPDRKLMGISFKASQGIIHSHILGMAHPQQLQLDSLLTEKGEANLEISDSTFLLKREMLKFESASKTVYEESFVPSVIEPSLGIGRLLLCIIEHSYRTRNDPTGERCYLSFPYFLAPTKCLILPISTNDEFEKLISKIIKLIINKNLSYKTDLSGASIGRRYARADEVGVPFAITVDFESLSKNTCTLREINTMTQIRLSIEEVSGVVESLVREEKTWEQISSQFGLIEMPVD